MEGNWKYVMRYWLEGEISIFIKVCILVYLSLCYCYFAGKLLKRWATRLAAFLPVVCLFLLLPLPLNSASFSGITAVFLAWFTNFKIIMFAFHNGPLSEKHISLPQFLAISCFPIKIKPQEKNANSTKSPSNGKSYKSLLNDVGFLILFLVLFKIYTYKNTLHPLIFMAIYCCHLYIQMKIVLDIAAFVAQVLLTAELEPQFNKPYVATSVQDFWGRRWNLAGTRVLRPSVYVPVRDYWAEIIGRKWAVIPAVMSTFLVSGLVHELIYYYLGRVGPNWEATWFFLLNGACVAIEIVVKREMKDRWRLPRLVATILTVGFVMLTGIWLFLPQMLRCKVPERAMAELLAVGEFFKDVFRAFYLTLPFS